MLKQLSGCHDTYIYSFDFVRINRDGGEMIMDDMILSSGYDGQVALWQTSPDMTEDKSAFIKDKELPES